MTKGLASRFAMGLAAVTLVSAQTVLTDPKKIADAQALFDTLQDSQSGCQVSQVKPHFIFSLRMQAGYLGQPGPSRSQAKWIVLTKITPEGKNPSPEYLADVVTSQPAGDHAAPIEGSYWLGRSRYSVDFLMFDGAGEVCRRQWQIDARLNSPVASFKLIVAPGAVADNFSDIRIPAGSKRIGRLSILLHAASLLQNQTSLLNMDRALLLDATAALIQEAAPRSVRIVAFNLEQQKELFRNENFTAAALADVARALSAVQPVTVDYRSLQNHASTSDFIQGLITRELQASESPDAVVFLGPRSIYKDKPASAWELPHGLKTRFFYLLWERPPFGSGAFLRNAQGEIVPTYSGGPPMAIDVDSYPSSNYGPNSGPDSIQYAVDRLRGMTLKVDSASSFAYAAAKVVHLSGASRR
jgi:hypothetical protein